MHAFARSFHRPHLTLTALALLAACAAAPELSAPPAHRATSTAEPERADAAAEPELPPITAPTPRLEEGEVGNDSGFKPTPGALPTPALAALNAAPAPTPMTEASASLRPPDAAAPPSAEPESLLTHLGPTTPPNVAAAMRLIEDGRQQLTQGHYDQALERFERGVAIDPTNAYGYYYLAQLYYLMQKYDQASAFAGRAAMLARTDRVWLARAYQLQGTVFEAVGRYADARKAYQKAVAADPNNVAARVGVGRLGSAQ